jgi:macrolide transport system ATP-binding/permease protein
MIQLRKIRKTYSMGDTEVVALKSVDLTIEAGDFVAIMGPSGSGKSTLMQILGLLDVPNSGSYEIFGKETAHLSEDEFAELRSRTIGFVFQQFNLLARTSAEENVALPSLYTPILENRSRAQKLLGAVGLAQRLDHRPNELSGGQQQRVAIARALMNDPPMILADEPTGNLDSASEKEILQILKDLNGRGITIILVTHEPEIAEHAKRVIRMRDGAIQTDERLVTLEPADPRAPPLRVSEEGSHPFWREISAHVRQGTKALVSNKVRSGLSMLGILIGVAAVIAMLAVGRGASESIQAQLASLGSNLLVLRPGALRPLGVALDAGLVSRLTLDDGKAIKAAFPQVTNTAPAVWSRAQVVYGDKNWSTSLLGTVPEFATMRAFVPKIGRFFRADEDQKRARVAVIGPTVVRELFGSSNPLGEYVKINRVIFQIVGILPAKGADAYQDRDDRIVLPLQTAMHRLMGKDYVDSIDIEVSDPDALDDTSDAIKHLMMRRHHFLPSQREAFEVRNMADIQAALSQSSRTMSLLLASIAAISLLVGGIGIMNIMLVSVTERTREIGLRKAVGARRADILLQFLIEAVVISSAGGGAGIGLGWLITLIMGKAAGWSVSVVPSSVLLSFFFSAAIGIVFGLWPARKASLLSPIQALRYE